MQEKHIFFSLILTKAEILGLKFSDFDFERHSVKIQRQLVSKIEMEEGGFKVKDYELILSNPKTENSIRELKVPDVILLEVEKRKERVQELKLKMGTEFQDYDLISCQKNGNPRALASLNTELRRLCERNSLPHITVHGLRHMFATILVEKEVPLAKVSALLGHGSIHTTFEFYLEIMEGTDQIMDFINREFVVEKEA